MKRAAVLVFFGALLSGPGAMLLVAVTRPQPAWTNVEAFVAAYHPVQSVPYVLGFLLLMGFVLFVAAAHAYGVGALRARTSAALVFAAVYAALVFTNYMLQTGYVPRAATVASPLLSELTMANPASLAWLLEMFGYAALGVATWLVADGFGGSRRGAAVRLMLKANGVVSLAGAVLTASIDGFVFSSLGLISFFAWNALILASFGLIAFTAETRCLLKEVR